MWRENNIKVRKILVIRILKQVSSGLWWKFRGWIGGRGWKGQVKIFLSSWHLERCQMEEFQRRRKSSMERKVFLPCANGDFPQLVQSWVVSRGLWCIGWGISVARKGCRAQWKKVESAGEERKRWSHGDKSLSKAGDVAIFQGIKVVNLSVQEGPGKRPNGPLDVQLRHIVKFLRAFPICNTQSVLWWSSQHVLNLSASCLKSIFNLSSWS